VQIPAKLSAEERALDEQLRLLAQTGAQKQALVAVVLKLSLVPTISKVLTLAVFLTRQSDNAGSVGRLFYRCFDSR